MELLGFGEALHGGEDILMLRNRLSQRLVENYGYRTIAIESSFPRARIVNDYVNGRNKESYESLREIGFSHGFGLLDVNRELVDWMRQYNSNPSHPVKVQFYGFDSPTKMTGIDSPRQALNFVLDYLESIDGESGQELRERIDLLIGPDADWENPAALMDPTKGIGRSSAATALRIEMEDLITQMQIHRPELAQKSGKDRYLEALQCALLARKMLNYHASMARSSSRRVAELLGIRDMMAGWSVSRSEFWQALCSHRNGLGRF